MVEEERKSSIVGFTILQIHLQMQLAGSSYESKSVKVLKWVSPSFKYTLNCKYTYNHPSNTPLTILQLHLQILQIHLQLHLQMQLDPTYSRKQNLQEDFFSFSGKSAGVKIAEAHSCIELILYGQAGITARIWVGLSNENVCNVGLG